MVHSRISGACLIGWMPQTAFKDVTLSSDALNQHPHLSIVLRQRTTQELQQTICLFGIQSQGAQQQPRQTSVVNTKPSALLRSDSQHIKPNKQGVNALAWDPVKVHEITNGSSSDFLIQRHIAPGQCLDQHHQSRKLLACHRIGTPVCKSFRGDLTHKFLGASTHLKGCYGSHCSGFYVGRSRPKDQVTNPGS